MTKQFIYACLALGFALAPALSYGQNNKDKDKDEKVEVYSDLEMANLNAKIYLDKSYEKIQFVDEEIHYENNTNNTNKGNIFNINNLEEYSNGLEKLFYFLINNVKPITKVTLNFSRKIDEVVRNRISSLQVLMKNKIVIIFIYHY